MVFNGNLMVFNGNLMVFQWCLMVFNEDLRMIYPLVMTDIAVENGHRINELSHEKL